MATHPLTRRTEAYRSDIDGLRGIAVLAVVFFHAFPKWFGSGFIGVDIFFVISGYLITGIILNDAYRGEFRYRRFYARRVRRIFPALAVTLAVSLAAGWFVLFPDDFLSLGQQVFGGAAFVANLVLWRQIGYFDHAAGSKPLLHLWSLGVEEQFYIVWPTVVVLSQRWRYRWALVLGLLAASFALTIAAVARRPDATFYLPMTRFWELLLGALVATLTAGNRSVSWSMSTRAIASWTGFILLVCGFATIDSTQPFPGWLALLPTLGVTLIIAAGQSPWLNRHVLGNRLLVGAGLISYPLYLWHWPLLVFQRTLQPDVTGVIPTSFVVVTSAFLAWCTYIFLERPVRFGRRRTSTVALLCLAVAAIGAAGALAATGKISPRSAQGKFDQIWKAAADWQPYGAAFHVLPFKGIEIHAIGPEDRAHVLFLGDSNIEQFGPRIERLWLEAPERYRPAFVAAVGGCPPIPNVRETNHPGCPGFLRDALELASTDRVGLVVVGACWNCYIRQDRGADVRFNYYVESDSGQRLTLNESPDADNQAISHLRTMLLSLSALKPTYLLLNVPGGPSVDPTSMIHRSLWGELRLQTPVLTRQSYLDRYGDVRTLLIETARLAHVQVIDPLDVLCPNVVCPSLTDDGRPIYKDGWHLRPFYVRERASFLDEPLRMP